MKTIFIDSFKIHDNQSDTGFFIRPPIGGLGFPEKRLSLYEKSGEHGAFVSNDLYGGRAITLEGTVVGATESQFESRRRSLEAAFASQKDSKILSIPRTFKITTLDDVPLQAEVYVRVFRFERTDLTHGRYFLELFSPEWPLDTQVLNNKTIELPSGGGAVYPLIYPIIYGAEVGGTAICVNAGNTEAYPIITLNGILNNPIIQNVTVGRFIELSLTIASGSAVVIDMKKRTIVLDGQSVLGNKTDGSRFWWLEPGDNTITFKSGSGSDTGNAQVQHRDAYLGV